MTKQQTNEVKVAVTVLIGAIPKVDLAKFVSEINTIGLFLDELDQDKTSIKQLLTLAVEFGYKAKEQGMNLQAAIEKGCQ